LEEVSGLGLLSLSTNSDSSFCRGLMTGIVPFWAEKKLRFIPLENALFEIAPCSTEHVFIFSTGDMQGK
jgi:hypothetical protein